MRKSWRDWFRFSKDKIELPPAEESPLLEVRDRVRKALDERKTDFCAWARPRRRHGPFTELLRDIDPDIEQHLDIEKEDPEDEGGSIASTASSSRLPTSRFRPASVWPPNWNRPGAISTPLFRQTRGALVKAFYRLGMAELAGNLRDDATIRLLHPHATG